MLRIHARLTAARRDQGRYCAHMAFPYPVFLDLTGVAVLVVGGGPVALRKAQGLAESGAIVTVVAPTIVEGLVDVATHLLRRPYESSDVEGFQLVMTATNDPEVNAQVGRDATALQIWVNSADDPDNCSFILPAVARRGLITVAVSTGGSSPALAGRLRTDIATTHLTAATEFAAADLGRQRAEIHATGASTEDIDWTERVEVALRGETESGAGRDAR